MRSKLGSLLRLRILDRYIIREVLPPTGLGLVLFTFIVLLQQVTLLTGILISRGADLATTLKLFFNILPSIFAITIPMAFLLGVLLAFGRLASESEIVAMRASGISPVQMLRPVIMLSIAAAGLTFYVMTVALPQANSVYRETFYTLVISKARSEIKPRVFTDEVLPSMVLYVSDVAADNGQWKNVFISDMRAPDKPRVILARTGYLAIDDKDKTVSLHLERGYIHSYDRANPKDYNLEYFRIGDFALPFDQIFPKIPLTKGGREMTLEELEASHVASLEKSRRLASEGRTAEAQVERMKAATFRVELHKKFSIPVACIVFGLLGLGLSLGNRKEARSAAFALSIVVISIYYIFLRLGEQAGDTEMVAPWIGMWGANIVLGIAGMLLIAMNQREAAFDPLNPRHYAAWIPRVTRRLRVRAESGDSAAARTSSPSGPRWHLLPNLLDRYIARQYLEFVALILVGFWAIFFLFHFMDLIDDVRNNHIAWTKVVHFYAFFTPEILHLVAPLAVLVATLTTFGVLSRRNEITAMMAGGISVYRATVPVLLMGVATSAALFVAGEFLLPSTTRIQTRDYNEIKGRPQQATNLLERRWIMAGNNRVYNYDYMSPGDLPGTHHAAANADGQPSFYGLSVFQLDPKNWNVDERLYAGRARWAGTGYELERGWRWTFRGKGVKYEPFVSKQTREVEPPTFFVHPEPAAATMRFMELRSHIASLQQLGVDVARLKVQLHRKVAFPLVAVIMSLIGIRFSFTVGRRGALYGVGLSILIAIMYWVCLSLFEQMGNNALLPPGLAAWAPNILFGAAGFYLMLTLDT